MINIIADMETDNSTDNYDSTPTVSITNDTSEEDNSSINSVPIMAIFLALIASCNSGKRFRQSIVTRN